jgi:hypothetical protein
MFFYLNATTKEMQLETLDLKIRKVFDDYKYDCSKMQLLDYLMECGNDEYQTLIKNGKLDLHELCKKIDLEYTTKISDVTVFWRMNKAKYFELAIAALISLGKPTHNAFQGRVFSRGTYTDNILQKRLLELSFEMSVLNSVNSNQFDEIDEVLISINNNVDRELTEGKIQLQNCKKLIKFKNTVITEEILDNAEAADDGSITNGDDVMISRLMMKVMMLVLTNTFKDMKKHDN